MLVYLVHPEHGVHIAYEEDEVRRLTEWYGWKRQEEKKPEVKQEAKRRGRPPKTKGEVKK